MTYQHKPDSGSLFVNDKRETDKHPNAKGSALIDGVEYWVSAWTNTKDDGSKWQSLRFERKDKQAPKAPPPKDDFEDDIPF